MPLYRVQVYRDERWVRQVEFVAPTPAVAAARVEGNMPVILDMDGWVRVDSDHAHGIESATEITPPESMGHEVIFSATDLLPSQELPGVQGA